MDDKEYEWHGYKKKMNESNTPPNWKRICRWKMWSGKNVKWRMINDAQNGFSWNYPKFVINQKIMLFYLKFYFQHDIYVLAFVEADVHRVGAESDAKGRIQASTSWWKNCSRLRVARASSVSCNSVIMLWIESCPYLLFSCKQSCILHTMFLNP